MRIEITGPEHTGKTSLIAYLNQVLKDIGMNVILQRADPQLDEKLEDLDKAKARLAGQDVIIFEMQTKI